MSFGGGAASIAESLLPNFAGNHSEETKLDHFVFDSDGMPADVAFARYHDLYSAGADAFRIGPKFRARVEGWRLDHFLLYDRRLSGVGHRRTPAIVEATELSHFTMTLLLEGSLRFEAAGQSHHMTECGDIFLHDVCVPGANYIDDAHIVTCAISRARLEAVFTDVDGLRGIVLPASHTHLVRDYIVSLLKTLPSLSVDSAPIVSSVLMSLLYAAVQSWDRDRPRTPSSRDDERMRQLIALIDEHIADPSFGAADLVAMSDLSRATLYRLAEARGGLAAVIRTHRLDYVRSRLDDPDDRRPFREIAAAAGMRSESAAAAAFAKQYRLSPDHYRRRAAEDARRASHKFIVWQEEVSRSRRRRS